ncbi:MAG TPA: hypothetical protein VFZ34_10910 [Blastocatellia bacterium]|nr:hypothetical protein [Blastocatellia bacterium]
MKIPLLFVALLLCSAISFAQSQTSPPAANEREPLKKEVTDDGKDATNITVVEGTLGKLSLQSAVSTKLSEVGDEVLAVLYEPVRSADGRVAIPRGTQFFGKVAQVKRAGKGQKEATIKLSFENMLMPYGAEKVAITVLAIDDYTNDEKYRSKDGEGKVGGGRSGGRTARNAGTGAGLGGIGGIFGGWTGAAIGAGAGAIAGVLMTKGNDLKLDQGTILRVKFDRDIKLPAFDEDNRGIKRIEDK